MQLICLQDMYNRIIYYVTTFLCQALGLITQNRQKSNAKKENAKKQLIKSLNSD